MPSKLSNLIYYQTGAEDPESPEPQERLSLAESLAQEEHEYILPVELSILILGELRDSVRIEDRSELFLNGIALYSLDFAAGACIGLAFVLHRKNPGPRSIELHSGFTAKVFENGFSNRTPFLRLEPQVRGEWSAQTAQSLPVWLRSGDGGKIPASIDRRAKYVNFWLGYLAAAERTNVPVDQLCHTIDSLAHAFRALWALFLVCGSTDEVCRLFDRFVDGAIVCLRSDAEKAHQVLQDAAAGASNLIFELARVEPRANSDEVGRAVGLISHSFARLLVYCASSPLKGRPDAVTIANVAMLEYAITLTEALHPSKDHFSASLRNYLGTLQIRPYRGKATIPETVATQEDMVLALCGLFQAANPLYWFDSEDRGPDLFHATGILVPRTQTVPLKNIVLEVAGRARVLWRKKDLPAPTLNRTISPFIPLRPVRPHDEQFDCMIGAQSLKRALQAEYLSRLILSQLLPDDFRYAMQYLPDWENQGSDQLDRLLFLLFLRAVPSDAAARVPMDLRPQFVAFLLSWQRSVGLHVWQDAEAAKIDPFEATQTLEGTRSWDSWLSAQNPDELIQIIDQAPLDQLASRPEALRSAAMELVQAVREHVARAADLEYRPFEWKVNGVPIGWVPLGLVAGWRETTDKVRSSVALTSPGSPSEGRLLGILEEMDAVQKSGHRLSLKYRHSSVPGIQTMPDFLGPEGTAHVDIDARCLSDFDFRLLKGSSDLAAWTHQVFPPAMPSARFLGLLTGDLPPIPFGLGTRSGTAARVSDESLVFQFSSRNVFSQRERIGKHCMVILGGESSTAQAVAVSASDLDLLRSQFAEVLIWKPTGNPFEFSRTRLSTQESEAKNDLWQVKAGMLEDLKHAHTFIYAGHGIVNGRADQSGLEIARGHPDDSLLNLLELRGAMRSQSPGVVVLCCCNGASRGNPAGISAIQSSHLSRLFLSAGSTFVMGAPFPIDRARTEDTHVPGLLRSLIHAGRPDSSLAISLLDRAAPETRAMMQFFGNPFLAFGGSTWRPVSPPHGDVACLSVSLESA